MDADKQVTTAPHTPELGTLLKEGVDLLRAQKPAEAKARFDAALALAPDTPAALHGAGLALYVAGKGEEAVPFFEKAVSLAPDMPIYANNYGMALVGQKRFFEAKSALILATRLKSDYADAWANLALVHMRLRDNEAEIERALLTALAVNAEHVHALTLLCELRQAQNRYRDAADVHLRLSDLLPGDARADHLTKAGMCHAKLKDFAAAVTLFAKAAEHAPDNAEVLAKLATSLGECGRLREAKNTFQKAAVAKGGKSIYRWKYLWFCPEFFPDAASIDAYWASLEHELAEAVAEAPVFDWKNLPAEGFAGSFNLTHLGRNHRPVLEQYARFFEKSFPFEKPPKRRGQERIRIGFFAAPGQGRGFYRTNANIIRNLDPSRFECALIYPRDHAPVFAPLRGPHIIHAPYSDTFEAIVNGIRAAKLDILYHWKAGETPITLCLPLCNTAPVQCTSWGTHGTSGIDRIDYSISWNETEPENAQEHYAERLFRLATTPLLESAPELPPLPSRAELGLPTRGTLYFCPHRIPKYHPDFDLYLREVLDADTEAHILLLFESHLPSQEMTRRRMLRAVGPKLARRLLFTPRVHPLRFLQLMAAADIVLESPIYSTSLTGFDAIYLGKPLITQEGSRLVERYAAANYRAMRIFDAPVAKNRDEYVRFALRLSQNRDEREDLSQRIRANAKIFTDTASITAAMSAFFEEAAR